jgi:chromosome partitioning protein
MRLEARRMGILLAVANRKGGVGKSTITTMLAHGFAGTGEQRVLVVDLDTQCNSSMILIGGEKWDAARRSGKTIADYFDEKFDKPRLRPDEFILHDVGDIEAPLGQLSLLNGSLDLEDVENELLHNRARANKDLYSAQRAVVGKFTTMLKDFADSFDVVIFDCPPGLSFSTLAALRVAHKVIVPFRPDFVSSYAVDRISTVIEDKQRLQDVQQIAKEKRRYISLVNFWRDGTFQRLNLGNVDASHPVMRTAIPQDDGIAEAFEYRGEPLSIDEKYGSGADVVRALCGEVVESIIMRYQREAAA